MVLSRKPFLSLAAAAFLLCETSGLPRGNSDEPPDGSVRPLPAIEREMRVAAAGQNFARLGALVDEAAALGTVEAVKAIIAHACRGDDREVEKRAFERLKALEDPACLALVWQEAVKNPNFKTRIILLGVANVHRQDPAAFAVIAHDAKDARRTLAAKAVEWLRKSKDVERAVPALLDALDLHARRAHGRIYHDIQNALRELTGAPLEALADWKNYWEGRKSGGKGRPGSGVTRAVPAKFFSVAIESDRILFIIDVSGSMLVKDPPLPEPKPGESSQPPQPGKTVVRKSKPAAKAKSEEEESDENLPIERQRLHRVREELIRTINSLPAHVNFTVLSYSNLIAFIDDPPKLIGATPENKKRAVEWVRAMKAAGETWTDTAFERALTQLKEEVDTIYLLSDGQPYRNGKSLPQDKVLEEIKTSNRFLNCRIHTIGFLQAGQNLQRFLKALAAQNDGTYTALR